MAKHRNNRGVHMDIRYGGDGHHSVFFTVNNLSYVIYLEDVGNCLNVSFSVRMGRCDDLGMAGNSAIVVLRQVVKAIQAVAAQCKIHEVTFTATSNRSRVYRRIIKRLGVDATIHEISGGECEFIVHV